MKYSNVKPLVVISTKNQTEFRIYSDLFSYPVHCQSQHHWQCQLLSFILMNFGYKYN